MSSIRDFSQIISEEISRLFVDDRRDLSRDEEIEVTEVDLIDQASLMDRDTDPNALADITFIEDEAPSAIQSGIEIQTGNLRAVLKGSSFGAIDGSSARISRTIISPILARAAFGSFSHEDRKLPMHEVMEMDVNFVVSHDNVVKQLDPNKVKKLQGRETRGYSLNLVATDLQAEMEIKSVKPSVDQWGDDMDYLIIDGPMYYRNKISDAIKAVRYGIKEGVQLFSIVKRSQDDAFTRHINYLAKEDPTLKSIAGWFHNDRDFFALNLRKGYRTPFYLQKNTREKELKIPDSMTRVCCWLKLKSGRVCRLEMPMQVAGIDQDLEPARDIVSMVYKMSLENQGKLPLCMERADTRALISYNDVKNYASVIDSYLRSLGLPTGDPDYWK